MKIFKTFQLFTAFFILLALASCANQGSGDSSNGSSAGSGRVSLLITDGVTDKFDQVNLTVESISFLKADDSAGANESIVFDQPRVINLLALQNYADLMVTTVIPAGTYNKIRLHVSQVELVKFSSDGAQPEVHIAKLPANGKIDLNPRGSFEVIDGGHLMVELDIDAEKSIHIIEKGNGKHGYNFRPVVFVNIVGEGEKETKLVLMDGMVLARKGAGFKLCDPAMKPDDEHDRDDDDDHHGDHSKKHDDDEGEYHDDYASCLAVEISDNTVLQNHLIETVADSSLENGDIVTVLGKAGGRYIDALHIVIESHDKKISDLAMFAGKATSVVDTESNFTMNTDDDNAVIQPLTALTVSLVDGSGVRIFDKKGNKVSTATIVTGTDIDVFGQATPDVISATRIKAAFVIIDNAVKLDKISGTIAAVNEADLQITVTVVNDIFSGDVCVDVNGAMLFMLGFVDEKVVSKEILLGELQLEMLIDVYGNRNDDASCNITADVVLVSEPLVAIPVGATLLVTGN